MVKKKSYKKMYEELKEEMSLSSHVKSYIHISWMGIVRFVLFLLSIGLSVGNFMLIISIGNIHNVWSLLASNSPNEVKATFTQLIILYPLIGEYILIGLSIVCLIALCKGGFSKLKSYNEEALIGGLILGLIVGLILGLILGLIGGLVAGLILGLILGLVAGLIWGLSEEFK